MPDEQTPAEKFTGLTGLWEKWSSLGVVGVIAGLMCYVVMVMVPQLQKAHLDAIREERAAAREDMGRALKHGDDASKGLWTSFRELSTKISDLNTTIARGQRTTHENQEKQIELQAKAFESKPDTELSK